MAELPEIRLVRAGSDSAAGTKLGGQPEWIQDAWQPECCGQRMRFLAQIDSLDIPQAELPDCAIVYVFFCPSCNGVDSALQCS